MIRDIFVILLLFLTFFAGPAHAQPAGQVLINSADWLDVYSGIMYANLEGMPYNFAISEPQARALMQYMDKDMDIHLIESQSVPYIADYKGTLENSGFKVTDEITSPGGKTLNLKLAGELDLSKFIVVDDIYGYNALSAASYAIKSRSWVLFADRTNINDVYGFLKGRKVEKVMIYGRVDNVVNQTLSEFNPEIINEGNRFDDNLAIVKKYMEISPSEYAILTNGDFIEASIMSGESPVIFIGTQTVPAQVIDYVKSSNIKSSTLIGNDLTNSGKMLKEATDINIYIKFGQGRQVTGKMSLVEDLDKFYLPKYELTMDAASAQYNVATKKLEVIYRNDAKVSEFYKSSLGVFSNGKLITTVGDDAAQYIEAQSDSGQAYNADLTDYVRSGNITTQLSAQFGEAPKTLNLVLTKALDVGMVSKQDASEVDVSDLTYDTNTQRIKLTLVNMGKVPGFATPVVNVRINGVQESLRLGNSVSLASGGKNTTSLRVGLTSADLADNPDAAVRVVYGEHPVLLIKSLDKRLPLQVTSGINFELIVIGVISAIILLLAVMWYRRKNKC